MSKVKLTKGEKQGIQLVADCFVVKDLLENFFAKDERSAPHVKEFEKHLRNAEPRVFLAEKELQRAISDARKVWIEELSKGEVL